MKIIRGELMLALAVVINSMGVVLLLHSGSGISAISSVPFSLNRIMPFLSLGTWTYIFQAFLIIVLALVMHGFRRKNLFSLITAFIYGNTLDIMMKALSIAPGDGMLMRTAYYLLGLVICAIGVSLLFNTYIPPEAYELFVKELSSRFGWDISRTKTIYDCCSCMIAVAMSFLFIGFGRFEGVKAGTVFCALVNP